MVFLPGELDDRACVLRFRDGLAVVGGRAGVVLVERRPVIIVPCLLDEPFGLAAITNRLLNVCPASQYEFVDPCKPTGSRFRLTSKRTFRD